MAKRYLFAADVDKIQDFIFRSARLQEVIGGSNLLSRFCDNGVTTLIDKIAYSYGTQGVNYEIVVNDGGSFRVWFDDEDKASQFNKHISEFYHRVTGGTITTLPKPVAYDDADPKEFCKANDTAANLLKTAKVSIPTKRPVLQVPYTAFCASCGISVASAHKAYYYDEPANYLCADCLRKRQERVDFFVGPEVAPDAEDADFFLNKFKQAIRLKHEALAQDKLWIPADAVDAICEFDSRRYVAYLVADANSMGELFRRFESEQSLSEFSKNLRKKVFDALASPMADLKTRTDEIAKNRKIKVRLRDKIKPMPLKDILPVVPLILGGDDLFVLLPAPFAIDFTRRFIQEYEKIMSDFLNELGPQKFDTPTLSAVVVICKSNYPYKLAHKRGEALLKQAKQMAKTAADNPRSVIDVEVILGSERRSVSAQAQGGDYRATLQPFWALGDADDAGLPIEALLDARLKLAKLAGKRIAQLKKLYLSQNLPKDHDAKDGSLALWNRELARICRRIGRMEEKAVGGEAEKLEEVLQSLGTPGGKKTGYWRKVSRHKQYFDGHALPDLLRWWEYCYKLDTEKSDYE